MLGRLDGPALAFASITVGLQLVHNPFNFFYVKVFLDVFKVRPGDFHLAQTLFLVWNAVNDPLFAYFLDNSNFGCFRSRRRSIMFGAPLLGAAFMLTWFAWGPPNSWIVGAHLIASLAMYDSLFTFVALAQCALFAEISTNYERRLENKRNQVLGGLLVSWAVPFLNEVSHNLSNFNNFRLGCLILCAASIAFLYYGGSRSHSIYDQPELKASNTIELAMEELEVESSELQQQQQQGVTSQIRQIILQRDFLAFVGTNFLQVFEATVWLNFLPIFMDRLGPTATGARSCVYLAIGAVPPLSIAVFLPVIKRIGHYRIIQLTLVFKCIAGPLVLACGAPSWLFAVFAASSSSLNSIAFSMFDMVLSEIIDEDKRQHSRPYPLSSMVFGSNALVTKPAISLAPMLIVALLNAYGYHGDEAASASEIVTGIMLRLACLLPCGLGVVQLLLWRTYSIRGERLG